MQTKKRSKEQSRPSLELQLHQQLLDRNWHFDDSPKAMRHYGGPVFVKHVEAVASQPEEAFRFDRMWEGWAQGDITLDVLLDAVARLEGVANQLEKAMCQEAEKLKGMSQAGGGGEKPA